MDGRATADGASDREIVTSRRTSVGRGAVYAAFQDPVLIGDM